MTKTKFKQYQHFFQILYLFISGAVLITFLFFNPIETIFTKVIFTTIFILGGFKFDFLDGKYVPILTRRFKNGYLNCINWFIQMFTFFQLVLLRDPINLFKGTMLTDSKGTLTNIGILVPIILGTFIFLSLFFTVTLPKVTGWMQAILISILIALLYLMELMQAFDSIAFTWFGKLPSNDILSLVSVFLAIIPMVYINLFNQNLPLPQWRKIKKWKQLIFLIPFFMVIFYIDSAVWLHPLNTWKMEDFFVVIFSLRSGFGEEFLFRILIMTIVAVALKKYEYGLIYSVITQAVLFGSMHLFNILAGQPLMPTLASTIDAFGVGILFGVIYLMTRNIGFVIAIHAVWDFCQSVVTGTGNMSVSGVEGFIISGSVAIMCILCSIYLIYKNKEQFLYKFETEIE